MDSKPFGPKIAKMIANKQGGELAHRGISVIAWDETELIPTGDGRITVREARSSLDSIYGWNGRKFVYLGAQLAH